MKDVKDFLNNDSFFEFVNYNSDLTMPECGFICREKASIILNWYLVQKDKPKQITYFKTIYICFTCYITFRKMQEEYYNNEQPQKKDEQYTCVFCKQDFKKNHDDEEGCFECIQNHHLNVGMSCYCRFCM